MIAKNSNIAGLRRKAIDTIRDAVIESHKLHGVDPMTIEQAAAHEAGHVVVAHALGDWINSVRLVRHSKLRHKWGGYHTRNAHQPPRIVAANHNPSYAFKAAIHFLSGVLGEMAAGLSHPSSSIDERVRADGLCRIVDEVMERPRGATVLLVGCVCDSVITENRAAFDAIRGSLVRTRRMSQADCDRMLKSVKKFDLAAFEEVYA